LLLLLLMVVLVMSIDHMAAETAMAGRIGSLL
jgi:hypothetical protein